MEYVKLLRATFSSFWLMYFFRLNKAFSCMDVLLHSFEIWLSNDNWLSIVIPKRVTDFSDSISLLSIWSFSWITFFVNFCRSINWNLSEFTIMLLILNQSTADSDSFFNVSRNALLFLDATEIALSSAKIHISEFFNTSGKSLRNILKRIGPRTDP